MVGLGGRARAWLIGGAGAGAAGAVLLWAPGGVLSWSGGVAAAAAAAYLSQDLPRQLGARLERRRARRESDSSEPLLVSMTIRNQDYVVLDDGEQTLEIPASGHTVRLVVTGAGPLPVVLTDLRVEVVSRADRSGDLSRHAAEIPVRRFVVLLDEEPPRVRALSSSDFPYQVGTDEVEVLDLEVRTEAGDVRWVLWLDWSCGGRSGSVRVDLDGRPLRTAARHPRPAAR
ncbi:hypothetical protein AB0G73_03025 [Streptomyces sp. NPDC020719]|uniref:hypothetical protein n=1 Tax=Streptomyces sp. NPDC020719 TaxID=3154896 RepID=UPI0033FE77A5